MLHDYGMSFIVTATSKSTVWAKKSHYDELQVSKERRLRESLLVQSWANRQRWISGRAKLFQIKKRLDRRRELIRL